MEDKSFKCQGKKYQCWTPQLVVIRKWHRRCQLLLRAIRQGCWLRVRNLSSKMIRSRMLVEDAYYDPEVEMDISSCFGGVQPLTPPPGGDSELEWSEWIHELEQIVKQLCKLHGRYGKTNDLNVLNGHRKGMKVTNRANAKNNSEGIWVNQRKVGFSPQLNRFQSHMFERMAQKMFDLHA